MGVLVFDKCFLTKKRGSHYMLVLVATVVVFRKVCKEGRTGGDLKNSRLVDNQGCCNG